MKKVISVLAMTLMIVGLSGCMDDPDGSKQNISSSTSSILRNYWHPCCTSQFNYSIKSHRINQ